MVFLRHVNGGRGERCNGPLSWGCCPPGPGQVHHYLVGRADSTCFPALVEGMGAPDGLSLEGKLNLFDSDRDPSSQLASRVHAFIRVEVSPEGAVLLYVRDAKANKQLVEQTRIRRQGRQLFLKNVWLKLEHGDVVHFVPFQVEKGQLELKAYNAFQYEFVGVGLCPGFQEGGTEDCVQGVVTLQDNTLAPHTVHLVLASACIGRIIGRGGNTIRGIEEEFKPLCILKCAREMNFHPGAGELGGRVVSIYAPTRAVAREVVRRVLDLAGPAQAWVVIPKDRLGRIFGVRGSTLKALSARHHGVYLHMGDPAPQVPDEQLLLCRGDQEDIVGVVTEVMSFLGPSPSGYQRDQDGVLWAGGGVFGKLKGVGTQGGREPSQSTEGGGVPPPPPPPFPCRNNGLSESRKGKRHIHNQIMRETFKGVRKLRRTERSRGGRCRNI